MSRNFILILFAVALHFELVKCAIPSPVPVALDMVTGFEGGKIFRESWYVPKRLYRISQVKMFKNKFDTSGFEVIFEIPTRYGLEGQPGYEPINQTFGDKDQDSDVETLMIDDDILAVAMCIDPGEIHPETNKVVGNDFDSFIFMDA